MKWFGALGVWFNRASERSGSQISQFILLLVSLPCFKASNFFFKAAFSLNQRRMFRIGVYQGGLYHDLLIKLDGVFEDVRRSPQTCHSLYDIGRRLDYIKALIGKEFY